ncbi:MAG: transglycosylase domain-containing protein [Ndongobacter sp.]|nr:transglycosylase domain-containing protein [Ndongobacter sp.]
MFKRVSIGILKFLGILFISMLIFLAIICGYLAGAMLKVAGESPEIHAKDMLANLKQSSVIVDPNGSLVERIETEEFREIVPFEKIPKHLINAFICAEDKRFYEHNGIDIWGIMSTLRDAVSGGGQRGASTLTMQLARNVYLSNDVEWTRKIQEMYISLKIDEELEKDEILEAYLNRVFFGQNAYGVQAAAQVYFSKNVWELDLAQCATLAGVVQAPSDYSLYETYRPSTVTDQRVLGETTINGDRYIAVYNPLAYERSKYVLEQMLKNGAITQEEYDQAIQEDVAATVRPPAKRAANLSTYFTDLVKDQAIVLLMDSQNISRSEASQLLYYGGLTVTATVDLELQRKLEDQFASMNTILNGDTSGASSPMNLELDYDDYGNIVNDDGYLQYFQRGNLMTSDLRVFIPDGQYSINADGSLTIDSLRIDPYSDYLDLADFYTVDEQGILRTHRVGTIPVETTHLLRDQGSRFTLSADFLAKNANFYSSVEGGIALNKDYYQVDDTGVMQPQSACAVIENTTGEIKAIVGGREQEGYHFLNRASSFPRQPGSSLKPLAVYAGVLDSGYNLASTMDDTPVDVLDGDVWPYNAYGSYYGILTVRNALKYSSNPVAVKWLDKITVSASKEYLSRFGIINRAHPERDTFIEASEDASANDEHRALALGAVTEGFTPLTMASGYQAIGNNGQHIEALAISSIVGSDGKVYFKNEHTATEALTPEINYQLLSALMDVANQPGYTAYSQIDGIDTAGKTGTTEGRSDLWFIGTTPYYTTAVWMGSDNANLQLSGTSAIPVQFYGALTRTIHEGLEPASFTRPEGIFETDVCTISGQKPTAACAADPRYPIITEIVSEKTAPKDNCKAHVWRDVDKRNNLLATKDTPQPLVETKSFVQRPTPYDPSAFAGILPDDWGYEAPTRYSDLPTKIDKTVVTNPDGSKTTTTYNEKWDKIEVTEYKDGTKVTVVTSLDGTVTTTTEKPTKPVAPQASESSSSESGSSESTSE